ncbi:MAG: HD-GYP domain-containing protein [Deltaproteobacteria bacterium]|nr:HD-GYP domain-containing protein [Deltaproteobacteria bacterium]
MSIVIPEYRISTDRLRIGVFIRLEGLKWHEHPFLFKSFKISSNDQIQTLKTMGIKQVICVPSKSTAQPLGEHETAAVSDEKPESPDPKASVEQLWHIKQERSEELKRRQETIVQCEKSYIASQERVGKIMAGVTAADPSSVEDAAAFAEGFSQNFLEDAESTLHLMRFTANDETTHYHSLNVAVLAMMLGREAGVPAEMMTVLCQGALFHDIGKSKIDRKILTKETALTRAETELIQLHPKYGVDLLAYSETFPKLGLIIIYQHHECSDGSGYPRGIAASQIHQLSKIVAIANVYDNHCNKRNPSDSLTPSEALSYMYSRQKAALGEKLLSSFIRCLSVYPPGTVVQLNNGSIGMVIAVKPGDQLHPNIVLYDPEIPPKDALIIDMQDDPELRIVQTIRPAALPQEIFDYLSPRTRITYYPEISTPGEPAP